MQTKEGELRFKVPKWSISGWVAPPSEFTAAAPEPEKPAPKAMPKAKPADDQDEF
jgi:hypothetical protein